MARNVWSEWEDCDKCGTNGCFSCNQEGGRRIDVSECDWCAREVEASTIDDRGRCYECVRDAEQDAARVQ